MTEFAAKCDTIMNKKKPEPKKEDPKKEEP